MRKQDACQNLSVILDVSISDGSGDFTSIGRPVTFQSERVPGTLCWRSKCRASWNTLSRCCLVARARCSPPSIDSCRSTSKLVDCWLAKLNQSYVLFDSASFSACLRPRLPGETPHMCVMCAFSSHLTLEASCVVAGNLPEASTYSCFSLTLFADQNAQAWLR